MGYTHYWYQSRAITPEELGRIAEDVKAVILASELPIRGWDGTGDPELSAEERVSFNGSGADSHETFQLNLLGDDFSFCKTAAKPYDVVVTASLLIAKDVLGDAIRLSSDGEDRDWVEGRKLAIRATGRTIAPFRMES